MNANKWETRIVRLSVGAMAVLGMASAMVGLRARVRTPGRPPRRCHGASRDHRHWGRGYHGHICRQDRRDPAPPPGQTMPGAWLFCSLNVG